MVVPRKVRCALPAKCNEAAELLWVLTRSRSLQTARSRGNFVAGMDRFGASGNASAGEASAANQRMSLSDFFFTLPYLCGMDRMVAGILM
ncbi:hypothetical protein MES5069_1160001 [Mesorhizobium escarrei]|uniref:Uncharacterized protein n=1 Tax=Mesorhizobium escarrei TaxID=666018 RepID=A0ABN8JC33_9HYPH|nr:hypothetical protein MES5069_1160001 [Mesorhizobium escarrei]